MWPTHNAPPRSSLSAPVAYLGAHPCLHLNDKINLHLQKISIRQEVWVLSSVESTRQRVPPMKRIPAREHDDVVESKRSDGTLRDNDERYRTLFDLAPVAVYS